MADPAVPRPALLIHAFYAADDTLPGGRAAGRLARLWQDLRADGLDRSITGLPAELRPAAPAAYLDRVRVLGALRGGGGIREAVAYQVHDAVGVSVMLAPDDPSATWTGIQHFWDTATGQRHVAGALGTAMIYLGLVSESGSPDLARRVRPAVPGDNDGPWPQAGCAFHDGITVWELPGHDRDEPVGRQRRLLAVAPEAAEDSLDRWLWSDDEPGLVPLTRYLLHAAKLRYEHAVFLRDLNDIREAVDAIDRVCADVGRSLADGLPVDRLVRAGRALADLQLRSTGVARSLSRVRAMIRTVATADANLATSLPSVVRDAPGGLLDNERQVTRWLTDQLRGEESYLQAAADRTAVVVAVGGSAVAERSLDRQESLTLLQVSLLGAVVTALAAVQSLQYHVPIPAPLRLPAIAFLTVLALWLPSAVLHWPRGRATGRGWRRLDIALLSLAAAVVCWLALTAVTRLGFSMLLPPWQSAPVVAAAALAGFECGRRLRNRRRPDDAPT
jgi:hypothetical protein